MKTRELTLADIGSIASTRGMLGAGIGLLLAGRLLDDQRRAIGWTLAMVRAITTIPLVMTVIGRPDKPTIR
jgi:hypothetical protein